MSTFHLQDFQGDDAGSNREYRVSWRPALLAELSGHANPIHEFGLLGIALGAAEYATYDPNPFARRAAPANPGPAAPAAQWSNYRDLKDDYEAQQKAEALASRSIISHLGDTPRELLRDPITRRYHNNLAIIIQTLDAHYLSVTRQELIEATSNLMERYSPAKDFKAHLTKHRQIHFTFQQAGQGLSEMDKVRYLTAGVEGDPEAKNCIQMYFTAFPNLAGQNFNDLAARLDTMMANRPPPTVSEFLGASTSAAASSAKLSAENETLRAELHEMKKAMRQLQVRGQHNPRAYCWTHGPCAHDGRQCMEKAVGHKEEATFNNRMGGRSHNPNRWRK